MKAPEELKEKIIQKAKELGFFRCGFSLGKIPENHCHSLENWLGHSYHAGMSYMENHIDLRTLKRDIVPGTSSVISLLFNYFSTDTIPDSSPSISRYAYGRDYHKVIRKKLKELIAFIKNESEVEAIRGFVDSAPVLEKALAMEAGLGWIGKNSCLINKERGSFFFISEIFSDLEFEPDQPASDHCGTCTRCIDACPVSAIIKDGVIDANRCISYLTIENRKEIPEEFLDSWGSQLFGCDICQDVCPWNRKALPHTEQEFDLKSGIRELKLTDWENMTEEEFEKLFQGTALMRAGYDGVMRNLSFLKKASKPDH